MININFSQRSVMGICAALALLLCFTLFYALWQWRNDWKLAHQPIRASEPKPDTSASVIAAIPDEHLFGQALSQEVPITDLQLQVTGIVKVQNAKDDQFSRAYISIAGQPSKIYKIGDNLINGVKIYAITIDAIILEREGRLEKLPLPREKLEFKPKPSRTISQ